MELTLGTCSTCWNKLLVIFSIFIVSECVLYELLVLQWNLRTTDTLGAGSSSVVERLSASGGFDKIN